MMAPEGDSIGAGQKQMLSYSILGFVAEIGTNENAKLHLHVARAI